MTRQLNRLQPWGICLLRIVLGVAMTYHGYQHLIPPGGLHRSNPLGGFDYFNHFVVSLGLPYWLGYVSVCTEFLGGLCLVLGFLTRSAAFMVAGNMLVALIKVNLHHGYAGSEYTLALIAMALLLVLTGSGTLALDRRLGLS
ncbi:DoxX family protein [Granulicella tundricola]|uniref:DoxX family protein n=1 Tax=Granulicella tundricola (strain ATCC BAA-1859 / DSM 23138 / MP5ACTX9) TaxID=1198114 RepID=E8WXK7_GRATM|nr:DoxX family protein [Granulicella tundricola]ADW68623.1 DoxX family protein [Granulicella tundricola MP5ACTX9]